LINQCQELIDMIHFNRICLAIDNAAAMGSSARQFAKY
jgi:hypothetical protein